MRKLIFTIAVFLGISAIKAQANYFNEAFRFNKFMEQVNSPDGKKLTYQDIEGDPYFQRAFATANIENATQAIQTRYNSYTDTVEILQEDQIFELPKSQKYSRISFPNKAATLVYVNLNNDTEGYYFELAPGKYSLLKKMKSEFRPGSKAVNSFTPAIEPRFENLDPIYYIKTDAQLIKVGKKEKEILDSFPDKKSELQTFIKTNKLKLSQEADLVKLVKFLNS